MSQRHEQSIDQVVLPKCSGVQECQQIVRQRSVLGALSAYEKSMIVSKEEKSNNQGIHTGTEAVSGHQAHAHLCR